MTSYTPRKIAEISDKDSFVSLFGNIVEIGDNFFVLEDKTGRIKIFTDKTVEDKSMVRVFCSRTGEGWKANILQDLTDVDLEIFEKADEAFRIVNQ